MVHDESKQTFARDATLTFHDEHYDILNFANRECRDNILKQFWSISTSKEKKGLKNLVVFYFQLSPKSLLVSSSR